MMPIIFRYMHQTLLIILAVLVSAIPLIVQAQQQPSPVFLVFFDSNSDGIDVNGQSILQQAVGVWRRMQDKGAVLVVGYNDRSLSPDESQQLSEKRAQNVAAALARLGIPEARLFVEGRGENDNRVPTGPGAREPQNRRVELVILSEREATQVQRHREQMTSDQSPAQSAPTPQMEQSANAAASSDNRGAVNQAVEGTIIGQQEQAASAPTTSEPQQPATESTFEREVHNLQNDGKSTSYIPVSIPHYVSPKIHMNDNFYTRSRLYKDRIELIADPQLRGSQQWELQMVGAGTIDNDGNGDIIYFNRLEPCSAVTLVKGQHSQMQPGRWENQETYASMITENICLAKDRLIVEDIVYVETRGSATDQMIKINQCRRGRLGGCILNDNDIGSYEIFPR